MDGTALFQAVAAIFIAQIYGVTLSISSYGLIIILSLIASIGAAAIPSAGLITLAMILTAIGVPIDGAAIFLPCHSRCGGDAGRRVVVEHTNDIALSFAEPARGSPPNAVPLIDSRQDHLLQECGIPIVFRT